MDRQNQAASLSNWTQFLLVTGFILSPTLYIIFYWDQLGAMLNPAEPS